MEYTKAEKARQYFKDGYNCCQAVVLAFIDELDIDEKNALSLASSFGGGFGRLREICGAVSGMGIVAGLKQGYSSPEANKNGKKAEHYAQTFENPALKNLSATTARHHKERFDRLFDYQNSHS